MQRARIRTRSSWSACFCPRGGPSRQHRSVLLHHRAVAVEAVSPADLGNRGCFSPSFAQKYWAYAICDVSLLPSKPGNRSHSRRRLHSRAAKIWLPDSRASRTWQIAAGGAVGGWASRREVGVALPGEAPAGRARSFQACAPPLRFSSRIGAFVSHSIFSERTIDPKKKLIHVAKPGSFFARCSNRALQRNAGRRGATR